MNWRKQAVEKAIVDLESHIEDLKKVKEEIHWSDPSAEEIAEIMEQLFRERANIANRIFMDYPPSYPNNRYYDPDPDSPFRMADFQNSNAESYSYPIIVGRLTLNETRIDSTIKRINLFIKQLKVKSRRRSDFQENNSFQLTEAKLKQMIRESMERSEYYRKLMELMTTEEGFMQAQSLFEMIEDTLDPKEKTFLRSYFDTIDLAKEVRSLMLERDAAQEKYNKIEDELLQGAPIDAEADRAYSESIRTSNAHYKVKKRFNTKMSTMFKHGDRSIFHVVNSITGKILKGAI